MKPIKDCQYAQDDGCCGYPDAPTPECHIDACPRMSPDVYGVIADLLEAAKAIRHWLEEDDTSFLNQRKLGEVMQELAKLIAKAEGE